MSTRANNRSGDRSWNNSFDKPSQRNNSFNSSHSSNQITGITVTPAVRTPKIDKDSTGTTLEVRDTNKHRDTIRETNITSTGMTITETGRGLTTEGDQTNTNTIETNIKHRSSSDSQTKT